MPYMYDLFWNKPPPLVDRHLRFELRERVLADGTVLKGVDGAEAIRLARRLKEAGVEAVAVCFLHSHRYPAHEEQFGRILRKHLPGVAISLSSEILREQGEYERTAATAVNAYVRPLMASYLSDVRKGVDEFGDSVRLMIMQSSGGVMTAEDASLRPVFALESGPAAGIVAARGLAQTLRLSNVIAFDMGGTTAKASLIEDGNILRSREYEVGGSLSSGSRFLRGGGELIRIPSIDIAEVGAGGGSLAWVDPAGGLQVGPRSAGANPGPACYGRGGSEATVTDANVVLGYIPAGPLASGDIVVSAELAEEAAHRLGVSLGVSALEAARGIHELANATTMRALRAVSSERGRDPRDFALLAYGGSGPVHAAALADELGIASVVIPPLAGLFSAVGLLYARTEFHDVRFCKLDARAPDVELLTNLYQAMEEHLPQMLGAAEPHEWLRSAGVRYKGQNWDIEVGLPDAEISPRGLSVLVDRFEVEHERLYGVRLEPHAPIEIRAARLAILGQPNGTPLGGVLKSRTGSRMSETRSVHFGVPDGRLETTIAARESIGSTPIAGPLLIDEYDTTVVVPPDWSVRRHARGALLLERLNKRKSPRAVRAAAGRTDVATRQVVANALGSIADEMATTIFRTAHSTVVRDFTDFSAALCSSTGDTIAQAVTIPLHLGSIPTAMNTLLTRYGERFAPGDIYIMNDPFDGGTHTPDIFIVKPIFSRKRLLGFAVTIAHHGDVGGRVPGTLACDNREIFEEGLRLPWTRLYIAEEPIHEIFRIIEANVRMPRLTLGDIIAQVAACTVAERALQDLAVRYGEARLEDWMQNLLDHTERLVRAGIQGWPNGSASFVDYLDSDGIEVREMAISVELTIQGDEVCADFSGSAPMARGAVNCTHSFVEAAVYQAILSAVTTAVPHTGGAFRPITVITRPGTITHLVMPGACSMRGVVGFRIFDAVNGALAELIPERVPAAGEGGNSIASFAGTTEAGERFVYPELLVGTWGARPNADGNDGLSNPCATTSNIPVEVAEVEFPIQIEHYGFVPDSGGPGQFRGGLAVARRWRVLVPAVTLQVRSDRQIHRPYGLNGGKAGMRSRNIVHRADGRAEALPPMFSTVLQVGDSYKHRIAGGGGWGDPLKRDPEAVARDVVAGAVSARAARKEYGVIIGPSGSPDFEATRRLRKSRSTAEWTREERG